MQKKVRGYLDKAGGGNSDKKKMRKRREKREKGIRI